MTGGTDAATAALRAHLLATRIAGDVDTPRSSNVRNAERMVERLPLYTFGLELRRPWTREEVLALMAERCGTSPDPALVDGPDTIDVDLTLAALARVRDRLRRAAARRERVLLATGHPTGLLALHVETAAALRAAGCTVVVVDVPPFPVLEHQDRRRPTHVRCLAGVHVLASGGELLHTHEPEPVRRLLAGLAAAGEPAPDLVVADHGWAGAAAQAGLEVLGYADCNDPALFVGEAEGLPLTVVPLDDNVRPHHYDAVADWLLDGVRPAGH